MLLLTSSIDSKNTFSCGSRGKYSKFFLQVPEAVNENSYEFLHTFFTFFLIINQ